MYSQNDERSSTARASATSSGHQQQHHHHHSHASDHGHGRGFHRYLGSYGSSSTPSSSLENQRSLEAQLSASTITTSSLFGDPVLPSARHADLLGGEDLYQNLKSNIELYHAKLFNEQERHRQAERDALFEQYANGGVMAGSAVDGQLGAYRTHSATGGSGSGSGSAGGSGIGSGRGPKSSVGHNMTTYGEVPPKSRNFSRTQSAGLGVDLSNLRSNVLDMDLLKQNDWIDFTEHEYRHSLIPTTSRTVADVQQFAGANITRKIENGVFQNPRAAAAARASRRNSVTDSAGMYGGRSAGGVSAISDKPPGSATFTVLGHGADALGYDGLPIGGIHDISTSSEANSEYDRIMRYGRTDPSTAIIRDKINTGSQNRVSDARQHKNTAFTIINEILPKSSSFDLTGNMRYSPYREKHRMASSRILSASSANTGLAPHGYYGYGYGSEYAEEGSISTPIVHPGIRRRFSSSELSVSAVGGHKREPSGTARSKRPTKSKTSLSIAGRRQPGVLEVMSKKASAAASAKVTITQPSEDGRSLTPTPSESGMSGTTGTEADRISIPDHQLRNLKLFGYKPFSGGRALSPVADKSSMENSQADLKLENSSSSSSAVKKGPVFNIRGLLLSPRQRDKAKEASTKPAPVDGKAVEASSRAQSKEPAEAGKEQDVPAPGSPPKKRRFNLARAIIESARGGGGGGGGGVEEKPQPKPPQAAPSKKEKMADGEQDEDGSERRKMALKMKLGIVRSGVRKDSEGNGVKEKKAKGKKGQTVSGAKGAGKKQTKPTASAKGVKRGKSGAKGRGYDDEDDDEEDRDDYGASYGRRGLDLGPNKGKKPTGSGGGMLKSALNYAASFRSRSERVGTAGVGAAGRKKPSGSDVPKGGKGAPGGRTGKMEMEKLTPNARRREKSAKANQASSVDVRGKSGTKQVAPGMGSRVKSGKAPAGGGGATSRAKSAAGPRGKTLRRSSSALAIDPGQQRKMNKLYEKNQKATTGTGKSSSSIVSKANRHANEGNQGASGPGSSMGGGSLSKSDSRGEMRGKGSSSGKMSDGGGGGSDTKERFEKRDSDRSLKKSDSNKSLATMAGKPKKSDSKSSLLTKRSDSRSSLHQTVAGGGEASGGDASGTELGGKSPHNSVHETAPEAAGVKSARPTPKLQSKGSLLSLISLKGSKRNLDRAAAAGEAGQRPDTAASMATAVDGGTMAASSTRLKSASVRNGPGAEGANNEEVPGGVAEKPMSTKPLRRLMSRGSLLSIKSIAHARSFTNIRPPTAGGADGVGAGGAGGEAMPPQTMTKVTEGSQEHDDTTDTETSHGADGQGSMGVATHELTVAGDGEGEKVSNEYNGERMRSPMAEHKQQQQGPGSRSPDMDNVSSANTESMRDRTRGQGQDVAGGGADGGGNNRLVSLICNKIFLLPKNFEI
ncbi:hypothetical protein ZHAS_00015551 [Anopheles sinensis]|uniref:Uncharacterized protein n=1 Tax=Anopheles sinensis TaxID=74873 RepID=A0A084WBI9_ANOSI|nr:hypothetical protein ZHAS_00015551 [Anopheles sinensis]